jgi:hypothetical protein
VTVVPASEANNTANATETPAAGIAGQDGQNGTVVIVPLPSGGAIAPILNISQTTCAACLGNLQFYCSQDNSCQSDALYNCSDSVNFVKTNINDACSGRSLNGLVCNSTQKVDLNKIATG